MLADALGTDGEAGRRVLGGIWHLPLGPGEESIRKWEKVRVRVTHAVTSEREGCEKEVLGLKERREQKSIAVPTSSGECLDMRKWGM